MCWYILVSLPWFVLRLQQFHPPLLFFFFPVHLGEIDVNRKLTITLAFSTFTVLDNYHLHLVPEHFHCSKVNALFIKQFSPISLCHQPLATTMAFFLWIYLFWVFHISRLIHMWLFVSAFSLACFQGSSCYPSFFFSSWVIFCCMYLSQFIYPCVHWWTFELFPSFSHFL